MLTSARARGRCAGRRAILDASVHVALREPDPAAGPRRALPAAGQPRARGRVTWLHGRMDSAEQQPRVVSVFRAVAAPTEAIFE